MPEANLVNDTHDPSLKSWVESANDPATDFPIQNLPLCSHLAEHDGHVHAHLGVLIGDSMLDVSALVEAGYFSDDEDLESALSLPSWNAIGARPGVPTNFRKKVQWFLRADSGAGQQARRLRAKVIKPLDDLRFLPPMLIPDYTDFYASKHHASTVGSMFRPDNPLLPNYTHVPIGYHGRASSIVQSGEHIRRPLGQLSPAEGQTTPTFAPCAMLDYEMELGIFIGRGNEQGTPIPMRDVASHLLGMCIVNDWSARDMQKWEYQPLGPFLAKNFATSISDCIVTMEALAPFRIPGPERAAGDPEPLGYLRSDEPWGLDITVEVLLRSRDMRERRMEPVRVSRSNFRHMYWTIAQMAVHHASNGCNLQAGDLLGSGTISGPDAGSRGCLLEATWDGPGKPRKPIELPTGEKRTFLADGDEVVMRAFCEREGYRRIGFGECSGIIEPAPKIPS
jgi:fumarylacetoacetase